MLEQRTKRTKPSNKEEEDGSSRKITVRALKSNDILKQCDPLYWNHMELTNLAAKVSFPRRANRPRPSDDARRCEAQISPSARIFCNSTTFSIITKG